MSEALLEGCYIGISFRAAAATAIAICCCFYALYRLYYAIILNLKDDYVKIGMFLAWLILSVFVCAAVRIYCEYSEVLEYNTHCLDYREQSGMAILWAQQEALQHL